LESRHLESRPRAAARLGLDRGCWCGGGHAWQEEVFPDGRSTLVLADGMGGEGPSAEEANSHTPDVEFWVRLAAAFTGPAVTAAWVALLADTLALRAGGGVAQGCVRPRNKPFQKRKGFRRGFSEFNRGFDGLLRRRRRAGVRAPTKQNPYTSRPWCCRCPRLHARHVVHCEQPPQSDELCSGGWLMASVGWRRVFGVVRNYCVCGSCVCGWRWWGFDGLLKCARRKTPPPQDTQTSPGKRRLGAGGELRQATEQVLGML
jgi:hypothetical protein